MTVDPSLAGLTPNELSYLVSTVRDLIGKRIDGINYAETRRTQIAVIGGAVAAVGLALLPLSTTASWQPLKSTYLVGAIGSIALGVLVWVVFAAQTNYDYPFAEPAQTWKWFYRQALPNKDKFGPKWHTLQKAATRKAETAEYQRQWELFKPAAIALSDSKVDATQDLKQLYLLHVNERYKNLFLTQLRTVLFRGVIVILVLTSAVLVGSAVWDNADRATSSGQVTRGTFDLRASWTPTGAVRGDGISGKDIEFRFVLNIRNGGATALAGTRLVAEDRSGKPIPVEFDVHSVVVAPHATTALAGHFWIAASDRGSLRKIDVQ